MESVKRKTDTRTDRQETTNEKKFNLAEEKSEQKSSNSTVIELAQPKPEINQELLKTIEKQQEKIEVLTAKLKAMVQRLTAAEKELEAVSSIISKEPIEIIKKLI